MESAFPHRDEFNAAGVTKRELFAAFALVGILAREAGDDIHSESWEHNVRAAYHAADLMIAALKRFVIVNHDGGYEFESNEPNLYRQITEAIDGAEKGTPS